MRGVKRLPLILAILALVGIVLASCKAPDEMTPKAKDSTDSTMKKAGGDD
jgi:hypothetical protein